MSIRPYQHEFVDATLGALVEFDRVLSVAPTGSGKTVMSGELIRRAGCRVLFLADAKELVWQAADKLGKWAGVMADVEMGDRHAAPSSGLIVATTQSIARRLDKYTPESFGLIIVDEAHRNTLGDQARRVLDYFSAAQVIGVTATPFRSDKRKLGSFYQKIAVEIGLVRLIREGWLSRIAIESIPSGIDITNVGTKGGDYDESQLGAVIEPHLNRLAEILKEKAANRRTVAFLPLVETSKRFVAACNLNGLKAVHVDGNDRELLKAFRAGEANVICNASLLTTGWDEPSVDCVYIIRPTKSFVLMSQMIGRGTRIHPGKDNLLVLDPLFVHDDIGGLIRPARLIAKNEEEAKRMDEIIIKSGGRMDLFAAQDEADKGMNSDRAAALIARLKECASRKRKTVDPIEFAMALGDADLADYEPETDAEAAPATSRQTEALERAGFDPQAIASKGLASRLMDTIVRRRGDGLATPKQLKWLIKFRHPSPQTATFGEATAFLDLKFNVRKPAEPASVAA